MAANKVFIQKGQEAPRYERPITASVMRNTFTNITEYTVVMHNVLVYERGSAAALALNIPN